MIAIDTNVLTDYNLIIQDFSLKQNKCNLHILDVSIEVVDDLKKVNLHYFEAEKKINEL